MGALVYPVLALAPGVFWLWFFLRRNVYGLAPKRLIALTFFLGMVSTIPAAIIELLLDESLLDDGFGSLASVAAAMLFVVGPVEETCKFLAVRLGAFRSRYFDEPVDGLVYAAAASLGFASLENLLYILHFGPEVMILRAPISTLGHVIFGSFWGYALGRQATDKSRGKALAPAAIAVAALVHGLYNVVVFAYPLAVLPMIGLGLWWVLSRFGWANRVSPFRYRRNFPRVACPGCRQYVSIVSRYCSYCGSQMGPPTGTLLCSHCGNSNRADAGYCATCGDRLERTLRR